MTTNLSKYRSDLDKLIGLGKKMSADLQLQLPKAKKTKKNESEEIKKAKKEIEGTFDEHYQKWFSESSALLHQILPSRLDEFERLYRGDSKRKDVNLLTYSIQDWVMGLRSTINEQTTKKHFEDLNVVLNRFRVQLEILKSAESRFESSLYDIQQIVQADLFDSELDSANNLLKNGFTRAAGSIAGIVLEKHLTQVCSNHTLVISKKQPTINDLNELLKSNNTIDVPNWRFIQRLGDLRNLCSHNKDREPLKEEVEELILGVDKISKTIY